MNRAIAHAVVYANPDGTYHIPSLHRTRDCAINSIPLFEGRLVAGVAEVMVCQPAVSGMWMRLRQAGTAPVDTSTPLVRAPVPA